MIRILYFLIFIIILSCSSIPRLNTIDLPPHNSIISRIQIPFLKNPWRLVHTIYAILPGGNRATFIGITIASPGRGHIHSVIMSVEGFVLFDAMFDGRLQINRAIYPFNSKDFAMGMINDIAIMFFIPNSSKIETGISYKGKYICRYIDGCNITDVVMDEQNVWKIFKYKNNAGPIRTIILSNVNKRGIPENIELIAHGLLGYKLHLDLVRAERVD